MADIITKDNNRRAGLLTSTSRVEAPFVLVEIAGKKFGVYNKKSTSGTTYEEEFPKYIQSLKIKKINGTVNEYAIVLIYPITINSDPNYFEKLFSSISATRAIKISYGDAMLPQYIYRDEECIITRISKSYGDNSITYTISATSTASFALMGTYDFSAKYNTKPSDVIRSIILDPTYKLYDVFWGMRQPGAIDKYIPRDDVEVNIPACNSISALEYLSILVSYMCPTNSTTNEYLRDVYTLSTLEDTNGPYIRIEKIKNSKTVVDKLCSYSIDIGFPSGNIITAFNVTQQDNWSIYYDYNSKISDSNYTNSIDSNGNLVRKYSPMLPDNELDKDESNRSWWSKVTAFPISATITFKGLLKPAILMQYVKLNVLYFGHKGNTSGYYIITSQEDSIDANGIFTTLGLTRVAEDEEYK